jgi:hypothetical protein
MSKLTKKEIADLFLSRSDEIILEIHARALGEDSLFPNANPTWLFKFFEMYLELAKSQPLVGDLEDINLSTEENIVDAIKSGKINPQDIKTTMEAIRTQHEARVLPQLEAKLDALKAGH